MSLTKEQLAARLTGREIGQETTKQDRADAKAAGLVIVYGASDDLMEVEGAIYDEVGCYGGGELSLQGVGLLGGANQITAMWDPGDGYSWRYKTDIPHATFEIIEDDEPYCRGIVFSIKSLTEEQDT